MLARPMLRASVRRNLPIRRFESTTTQKAADTAKETASKAVQGLSRVTSAAGPAIAGAAKGVAGALGRVGGRTGRVIGFIEKQTPWVIYYSKVGLELSKIVFKGQNMSPPSMATFQSYYQSAWSTIKQPAKILETVKNTVQSTPQGSGYIRGFSNAQLAAGGVLFAECLGFFTVGEMLGRFKLVGYHGEIQHDH